MQARWAKMWYFQEQCYIFFYLHQSYFFITKRNEKRSVKATLKYFFNFWYSSSLKYSIVKNCLQNILQYSNDLSRLTENVNVLINMFASMIFIVIRNSSIFFDYLSTVFLVSFIRNTRICNYLWQTIEIPVENPVVEHMEICYWFWYCIKLVETLKLEDFSHFFSDFTVDTCVACLIHAKQELNFTRKYLLTTTALLRSDIEKLPFSLILAGNLRASLIG